MIDGALDGTTDSLIWLIVACIIYDQGFVTKACEERNAVVGCDRLSAFTFIGPRSWEDC
jgi:hypothetical protein